MVGDGARDGRGNALERIVANDDQRGNLTMRSGYGPWARLLLCAGVIGSGSIGCMSTPKYPGVDPAPYTAARATGETAFADPRFEQTLPREIQKVSMPEYVVEPPDILRIELLRVVPTADYKVEAQDVLSIQITYPSQTEPFGGEILIGPDGIINLGQTFGTIDRRDSQSNRSASVESERERPEGLRFARVVAGAVADSR
jgi:hypothetical protein